MADFVIFENPGNKAARLEQENARLRAENRRLRQALGESESNEVVRSVATPQNQQQTFTAGACAVTIGKKAGRPTAIPSLEQQDANKPAQVKIFNAAEDANAELELEIAAAVSSRPTAPRRAQLPPSRRVGGGPGGVEFDLASLKPTPVKSKLDDAEQRFSMLEIDEEQKQGGKAG
jgi:hypothetical protein